MYDDLRHAVVEWDVIQRSRIALGNMVAAFKRRGREVPPWLSFEDDDVPGMLEALRGHERDAFKAVRRAAQGELWLERVAHFVDATMGLGPAILCIVGLLPPLPGFATPAKLWKYLGLHVLFGDHCVTVAHASRVADGASDQDAGDLQETGVGYAPRRPSCGPSCKKKECPHDDRWSFGLKSYAISRVVPPIIKCLASPYRAVYDERKAHTLITHPEWALERNKAGKLVPKLHYERDAQRYVAKRVWRDIWRSAHGQRCDDTQGGPVVPIANSQSEVA